MTGAGAITLYGLFGESLQCSRGYCLSGELQLLCISTLVVLFVQDKKREVRQDCGTMACIEEGT